MPAPWAREGVSNNAEKVDREWEELVVSGHLFQCGPCKREEGI